MVKRIHHDFSSKISYNIEWNSVKCTFLYARLQTGRIMVWWSPSVRPPGTPSVTVFRTFLPHALTYWTEILHSLHVTFFLWTFNQVRMSSISVNFYTPVLRRDVLWYGNVRPSGSPSDCPSVRSSVRLSVCPSGSPSSRFPHFSHTCFDILSWNFAHDFVLMYYRSSLSVLTLRQFLKELCLFVNFKYR